MSFEEWDKLNPVTSNLSASSLRQQGWNAATAEAEKRAEEHDYRLVSNHANWHMLGHPNPQPDGWAKELTEAGITANNCNICKSIKEHDKQVAAEARRDEHQTICTECLDGHSWRCTRGAELNRLAAIPASGQAAIFRKWYL
jgi:hypothetical protein